MDKKKPRGRPRIPDSQKRKPAFVMRLTDDELAKIRLAAGDNVEGWSRAVLLRAAKRR
jgi:hypothetical protein